MDKKEFKAWGTFKKGWESDEVEEEWTTRKMSKVDRDYAGKNGALRLDVDKGSDKLTVSERYVDAGAEESSDQFKKPTQEDREGLRYFAGTASGGKESANFLAGKRMGWKAENKSDGEDEEEAANEDEGAEGDGDAAQIDAIKRTAIFNKSETGFKALRSQLEEATKAAARRLSTIEELKAEIPSLKEDVAFDSYCATSGFRVQIGLLCLGLRSSADLFKALAVEDQPPVSQPPALLAIQDGLEEGGGSGTGEADVPHPAGGGAGGASSSSAPVAPVAVAASGPPLVVVTCEATSLEALFEKNPRKLPLKNPQSLLCLDEMGNLLLSVLSMETVADIEAFKKEWAGAADACKAVVSGIQKGDAAVKQHINNKRAKTQREANKQKTDEEKKQLEAAKANAQAIAARLKAPKGGSNVAMAIMQAQVSCFTSIDVLKQATESASKDAPCIYAGAPAVDTWAADEGVQVEMASFGGTYKKTEDIQSGRTQRPIIKKELRDPTETMFDALQPVNYLSIAELSGGKSFEKALWLYGFTEDMNNFNFPPQCMAMTRVYGGCMEFYMIAAADVKNAGLAAPGSDGLPSFASTTLDHVREQFLGLKGARLDELKEQGIRIYHGKLEPNMAIFIPAGFLVLEACVQGPLIFGVRKSYAQGPSEHAVQNCSDAAQVLKASGSNMSKLESVIDAMRKVTVAAAAPEEAQVEA